MGDVQRALLQLGSGRALQGLRPCLDDIVDILTILVYRS